MYVCMYVSMNVKHTGRDDCNGIETELALWDVGPHGRVVHVGPGQVRALLSGEHHAGAAHCHCYVQPAVEGHRIESRRGSRYYSSQSNHYTHGKARSGYS